MEYILNALVYINNLYENSRLNTYYFYDKKNKNILNITYIIYLLSIPKLNLIDFILDTNLIFLDDGKKIKKYTNTDYENKLSKIIKNITYKDANNEIELKELKKNSIRINKNVNVIMLLLFFDKISIMSDSVLEIKYFTESPKTIKLNENLILDDIL
tara:strand:+ start:134 stop:604 length:471 start_codon:yes stop_codon:yes gene_type:complete